MYKASTKKKKIYKNYLLLFFEGDFFSISGKRRAFTELTAWYDKEVQQKKRQQRAGWQAGSNDSSMWIVW